MLELAALVMAVAAIVATLHWKRRANSALFAGRIEPSFPLITVTVLSVLAGVALIPGVRRHDEERRLDRVADVLVGAPVHVHCQSFGQSFVDTGVELGYVKFNPDGVPEHSTLIKREQCGLLRSYLSSHGNHPSLDEVVAVHVLTHESMHMRGATVEAIAECQAVQRDSETASLLGASETNARLTALMYWQQVYPHMPSAYTTDDCKPGGPLDEPLPTAPWIVPTSG